MRLQLEGRKGSRWARADEGVVAVLGADERLDDRWWFGLREKEFSDRDALGVILLCGSGEEVVDLGLAGSRVRELLPQLSLEPRRGERKLNIFRRGGRYELQVPGGRPVDVTAARGDLSWLGAPSQSGRDRTAGADGSPGAQPKDEPVAAFFARVRKGLLEPLDPTGLADGDIVLVTVAKAPTMPTSAALRRIVARGGPRSLPADFAEQHDRYARALQR
jgi:hypothetical protein